MSERSDQTNLLTTWLEELEPDFLASAEARMAKAEQLEHDEAVVDLSKRIDYIYREADRLRGHSMTQHHSWPVGGGWKHVLLSPTSEKGEKWQPSETGRTRYLQVTTNKEIRSEDEQVERVNKDYFVDFQLGAIITYEGLATLRGLSWEPVGVCPSLITEDDLEEGPGRYWFEGYDPLLPTLDSMTTLVELRCQSRQATELHQLLAGLGSATLDSQKEYE